MNKIYCFLCKILLWESEIDIIDYCSECLRDMDGRVSNKVCMMCSVVSKDANFFIHCEDCKARVQEIIAKKTRKS